MSLAITSSALVLGCLDNLVRTGDEPAPDASHTQVMSLAITRDALVLGCLGGELLLITHLSQVLQVRLREYILTAAERIWHM